MTGTLYVCATPIGNLEDITLRVLRVLKEVDLILAEDTRHTQKLLNHYDITTKTMSYHEHNKNSKNHIVVNKLLEGNNLAIVTDAGMPGISDPGEDIIRLCYENNIPITICPGATAVVTALVLSGISSRRYCFEAFLPMDKKELKQVLTSLEKEVRTIVIYEAPHRLITTLKNLKNHLGDNRKIAVIREMTKKFEEVIKLSITDMIDYFTTTEPRGEIVMVIEGIDQNKLDKDEQDIWLDMDIYNHINLYIDKGLSEKDAMKQVAKDRGVSKRDIYNEVKK